MRDLQTKCISWANFYHSQLVLISPTMNTCWHGEGIRKLQLLNLSISDIHVVFDEAPFMYPLLITSKTQCRVRFLSFMNLIDKLALCVVRSKTCHPGSFPTPSRGSSPIWLLTQTTVTNSVQQTLKCLGTCQALTCHWKQKQTNEISILHSVMVHWVRRLRPLRAAEWKWSCWHESGMRCS